MSVTVGEACQMNALAYRPAQALVEPVGDWRVSGVESCESTGCLVVRWEHPQAGTYLAVRGTCCMRDALDSVRVFLGHPPRARIGFLVGYIQAHCSQALEQGRLVVGGHSLGGLVAMGAAARWRLPGLVQNAPGWLVDAPDPAHLEKMVEVRTGGDVVGVWGHGVPTTITVPDPEAGTWSLVRNHNVYRQVALVTESELAHVPLDSPALGQWAPVAQARVSAGDTVAWMRATLARMREDRALNRQAGPAAANPALRKRA